LPKLCSRRGVPGEDGGIDFHNPEVGVGDGTSIGNGERFPKDGREGAPGVDDGPSTGLAKVAENFGALFGETAQRVFESGASASVGLV
jgi:hypothetical protein